MTDRPKHALQLSSDLRPSKFPKITLPDLSEDAEDQNQLLEGDMPHNPRLQRYLVATEYIGTRFCGSQKQSTVRTVSGVLEDAFQKFIGQPVSVFCSSRTDAGVHALSNVFHVDVERISKRKPGEVVGNEYENVQLPPHEPAVVRRAVNHFLQKNEGDVSVIDVQCVPADFHARHRAQERTYFYRLLSGPEPLSTFEKDRVWHVIELLDLKSMQEACKVLAGHHDFSSFRAAGCQAKSPIRTLDELHVCEVASTPNFPSMEERKQISLGKENLRECLENCEIGFGARRKHRSFVVTARARSFLYHQVRLLVGVLKAVGTGDLLVSDVERILDAKDVSAASGMAPACGLYLGQVKYDDLRPRE